MPHVEAGLAEPRPTLLDDFTIKNTALADTGSGLVHPLVPNEDQVWTTDWYVVYRALLRALQTSTGGVRLQTGTKVTNAYLTKDGRWNVISEGKKDEQADLLIGADGAYSTVRSLVLPDLQPQYAGYVSWRGRFSAKNTPTQIQAVLKGELLWIKMPQHYIIL